MCQGGCCRETPDEAFDTMSTEDRVVDTVEDDWRRFAETHFADPKQEVCIIDFGTRLALLWRHEWQQGKFFTIWQREDDPDDLPTLSKL
jgi:hypothetical protein